MVSTLFGKCVVVLILHSAQSQYTSGVDLDFDKMKMFVPDIIPKVPDKMMRVIFKAEPLFFGKEFTPTQVKMMPKVHWETEPEALYTLSMVDIDFSDPWDARLGEFLHWLVVNIPGGDPLYDVPVASGKVIAEYVGACPPKDGGIHRYLLLAYKQPGTLDMYSAMYIPERVRADRYNFKMTTFAEKYNLSGPIAGNFFPAKYDEWVDEINKMFDEDAMME